MALKRLSITALLAGALVGLSLTAARADEPMTADQADAAAQAARKEADHYRQLGGVGYKAGLVQASEAEAARYDAMAQKLAPAPPRPSRRPRRPPPSATRRPPRSRMRR